MGMSVGVGLSAAMGAGVNMGIHLGGLMQNGLAFGQGMLQQQMYSAPGQLSQPNANNLPQQDTLFNFDNTIQDCQDATYDDDAPMGRRVRTGSIRMMDGNENPLDNEIKLEAASLSASQP